MVSLSKAFHLFFHSEQNGQTAVTAFSYSYSVNHFSYEFYFFLIARRQKRMLLIALCTIRPKYSTGITCGHHNCFQLLWQVQNVTLSKLNCVHVLVGSRKELW